LRRRAVALFLAATACAEPSHFESPLAVTVDRVTSAATLVIDATQQKQRITGFGASSAWTGGSISPATADLFFDVERGLGLSLLRMHIAPDGTTSETNTAKLAVARGVKVWAAPWSPPGEWKTSGTDTDGGSLLPEHYQDWADRLTAFVNAEAAAGVPLMALSAQNEPNWKATWESCVYSPSDLTTFVRDYLAPTVARDCPGLKLLTPETIDWNTLAGFANPLLADPGAAAAVDIVAVHDYGGVPYAYTAPADHGKEFWETEVSYDDQVGVLAALETARQIHQHLTTGGVNAFHYWWLVTDGTSGGLLVNGALAPQGYALGHYSKFVRPGYVRLDVPAQPANGVSTSAFADPDSGRIVIVAVNENTSAVDLSLHFAGTPPVALTPWLTTTDVSLTAQATIPFTDPLSYSLPAQSITTLVTTDDHMPSNGEGGQPNQPDENAGIGPGGASGAAGEVAIPMGSGGTSTQASGGTSSTRPGHGGTTSTSRGGSGGTAGTTSEGGASDVLDAGVVDDGGVRHVPGKYYACLCRLPGGDRGGSGESLPVLAAVLTLFGRRRSRHGRVVRSNR